MLDIAYLALMLACLAGCVLLVDRLSRSDESATSSGAASPVAGSPGVQSPDAASTYPAPSDPTGTGQ